MSTAKTEFIRARIEPDLKHKVEAILEKIGLNQTEAIRLFYSQIVLNEGLPFDVKIPNRETRKAIRDTEKGIGLTYYENTEEMFKDLGL